jgi:hypothetical protein
MSLALHNDSNHCYFYSKALLNNQLIHEVDAELVRHAYLECLVPYYLKSVWFRMKW